MILFFAPSNQTDGQVGRKAGRKAGRQPSRPHGSLVADYSSLSGLSFSSPRPAAVSPISVETVVGMIVVRRRRADGAVAPAFPCHVRCVLVQNLLPPFVVGVPVTPKQAKHSLLPLITECRLSLALSLCTLLVDCWRIGLTAS